MTLGFGILTLFVRHDWPWRAVQLALFGAAAVQTWRGRIVPFASVPSMGLLAAVAWGLVQAGSGLSVYPWTSTDRALIWLAWWAAFALAASLPRGGVLGWLAVFSGALAVVALVQANTAPGKAFWLFETGFPDGVFGPFVYGNQYAAFILLTLPLVVLRALAPTPQRVAWLALAAAMTVSVVAAGSTAGTGLVAAEIVLVLRRERSFRLAAPLALLVLLFLGIAGIAPLARKFERNDPLYARRMATAATLAMARDRPATGFGLGTWNLVYPAYALFDDGRFDNQAHNDWAQWAAEGGLPFLALLLAVAAALTPAAWRSRWGVGLLFVWVHCLLEFHFQQRHAFGALFWAMAGWAMRERTRASASTTAPSPGRSRSDHES